jgi:hypothetical protein
VATAEAWRRQLVNVQATDAQIKRILDELARNASRLLARSGRGFSADVRHAQISNAMAAVLQLESDMFGKLTPVVESGKQEATNIALNAMSDLEERLGENGKFFKYPFLQASRNNIENLRSRLLLDINLSGQVYQTKALAAGWVQREVNRGILLGRSPAEIANAVKEMIRPDVPGGVSFAAKRLGRTELNNSFHETTKRAMQGRPWIESVDWNLSGSHPRLDICNILHDKGPYDKENVPPKPHPQCLCFITAATPSQEEFINDLMNGKYDDWIDENNGYQFTDSALTGPANEIRERLIQYRVEGKSWAEIAKLEDLGNPGAARRAFTKYTGLKDYKTKGPEIRRMAEGGGMPKPIAPHTLLPHPPPIPAPPAGFQTTRDKLLDIVTRLNGSVDSNFFDEIDQRHVRGIYKVFDEFLKKHRRIQIHLSADMPYEYRADAFAVTRRYLNDTSLESDMVWNNKFFGIRGNHYAWVHSVEGHHFMPMASAEESSEYVAWHELGHVLWGSLSAEEQTNAITIGLLGVQEELIKEELVDASFVIAKDVQLGLQLAKADNLISGYASQKIKEFVAEGYASAHMGKPARWAKAMSDYMEMAYKKRWGR